MTARDLMRFLASRGGALRPLAAVIHCLHKVGAIKVEGRGFSAHKLTHREAAAMVIAYAGSEIHSHCADRLAILRGLCPRGHLILGGTSIAGNFGALMKACFATPDLLLYVEDIRIAKNADCAIVRTTNGCVVAYRDDDEKTDRVLNGMLFTGTLPRKLLRDIALQLGASTAGQEAA